MNPVLLLALVPGTWDVNTAVRTAAADAAVTAHPRDVRYLYVPGGKLEDLQVASLVANYLSDAPVAIRPKVLPGGVVKFRGSEYSDRFLRVWEELRFDPALNILETPDVRKFARRPPIRSSVIRAVDKNIDPVAWAALVDATGSQAPIVTYGYFVTRALSTIQGNEVAKEIYGGLYYQFAGYRRGFAKGTDEDNFFESVGIGNIAAGVTAERIFENARSDQRVAVFKSAVTGKPRRADLLKSLIARDSQGVVSVTHDLRNRDIDIGTHPIANLSNFKDFAREVIHERRNGLQGFLLFDGQGALQDEVPNDVAADHTIPAPETSILQPAIGCIRCHGPEGGWRILKNDVKKIANPEDFDIFEDAERLVGLYGGDPERKLLPRARDDYANAILAATGPWVRSKDQTDIVQLASAKIADVWREHNYVPVGAARALDELGVPYEGNPVVALKAAILPPAPSHDGRVREDPRIAALKVGLTINRSDWDLARGFAAARLRRNK